MKAALFFLVLIAPATVYTQSAAQKKLEKDFVKELCTCLEKYSAGEPEKLLYNQTENCIRQFLISRETEFTQIAKERKDTAGSDYEKGRALGQEMVFNTVDDLVEDCMIYRESLQEYKAAAIRQMKVPQDSVLSTISALKEKEPLITDTKKLSTFCTLIGILYEFAGNKKEALAYYNKALKIYPSSQAKAFKALLQKTDK